MQGQVASLQDQVGNLTQVINGDVHSQVGQLGAQIGDLTQVVKGDVYSQIGELRQQINNATFYRSEQSRLSSLMNLRLECYSAATNATIGDCTVKVRLLAEAAVAESEVTPSSKAPVAIPLRRSLALTATREGFQPVEVVHEYVEDGTTAVFRIVMEPTR